MNNEVDTTTNRPGLPPSAWNLTTALFDEQSAVGDLITARAQAQPHAVALLDLSGRSVTYRELDETSNRVAALLLDAGLRPGDKVAFCADHRIEAVLALVGVLKAGCAYVPLDPRWPRARVATVLRHAAVKGAVVDAAALRTIDEIRFELPGYCHVLTLDGLAELTSLPDTERGDVRLLWDEVASATDPLQAAGFNIGQDGPILTESDVARYVDRVVWLVDRAGGVGARVLEVGCGSGLVLRALAGRTTWYVGVDPSPVAVAANRAWARQHGPHVRVVEAFADRLDTVPGILRDGHRAEEPGFDVALLASTVQFFPNLAYLSRVIEQLAAMLGQGTIVLADLIDPNGEHTGLRVSPAYLTCLAQRLPYVTQAEILRRPQTETVPVLRERYDVILRIDHTRTGSARPVTAFWDDLRRFDGTLPAPRVSSDSEAYVIFTSGSSGEPKGVVVRHRSVVNLIEWVNRTYGVGPGDRLAFTTSFAFDLSVYDMFGILAAGASALLIADADLAEPTRLARVVLEHAITFWDSAPAAMSAILPFLSPGNDVLRLVFLSGDWVPLTLPEALKALFPKVSVVALGGATECTVWSNHFVVDDVDPAWASIPYGTPMQNARYYVLDDNRQLCPVGIPGELYIAGECVADGYLNDAALTRSKFLPDPWAVRPGDRMYRTGDRARWRPEGFLEFLGRTDDQVKVRGYRIELGDVRAALLECASVADAVVVTMPGDGGPQIAAYIIAADRDGTVAPDAVASVRRQLAERLPGYMMPARLGQVTAFPVTANGKVDRTALLAMLGDDAAARNAATKDQNGPGPGSGSGLAPANRAAATVEEAWDNAVGRQARGAGLSFLEAGGDSLAASRLAGWCRRTLGRDVRVQQILVAATFSELAAAIAAAPAYVEPTGRRTPFPLPLGDWQIKLVSHEMMLLDTKAYWDVLVITAPPTPLDRLNQILRGLRTAHPYLHSRMEDTDDGDIRLVASADNLAFEQVPSAAGESPADTARRYWDTADLDVFTALARFAVSATPAGDHFLTIVVHHLLIDEAALRTLLEDLAAALTGTDPAPHAHLPLPQRPTPTDVGVAPSFGDPFWRVGDDHAAAACAAWDLTADAVQALRAPGATAFSRFAAHVAAALGPGEHLLVYPRSHRLPGAEDRVLLYLSNGHGMILRGATPHADLTRSALEQLGPAPQLSADVPSSLCAVTVVDLDALAGLAPDVDVQTVGLSRARFGLGCSLHLLPGGRARVVLDGIASPGFDTVTVRLAEALPPNGPVHRHTRQLGQFR